MESATVKEMSLYLADIGNSALKVYSLNKTCFTYAYEEDSDKLTRFLAGARPERLLVASVSPRGWALLQDQLAGLAPPPVVHKITYQSPFSFTIGIEQPATAGVDRLVNVEAALARGFKPPLAVISAGSAITIDTVLVEKDRPVFKGGLIIPGEKLQKQALQAFTGIPAELIFRDVPDRGPQEGAVYPLWGRMSSEAIHYGIRNCILYGINEVLARLKKNCILHTMLFTGGNGQSLFEDLTALGCFSNRELYYERELPYHGLLALAGKLNLV